MYKSASLFTFLIFCITLVSAQQQTFIKLYDSIRNNLPREKLYVHFDKSNYTATDTIWFKAYLVNGTLNTPSNTSGVIYTEIIDENNDVIQTVALPTISGLTWGAFALNERQFKTGTYTFRAYTNWMQNFGSSHFFQKQLKVFSLTAGSIETTNTSTIKSPLASKQTTAGNNRNSTIDLQFLPEGGNLTVGANQKIAFKALDANGKGISVNGEILDSKNNVVAKFASNAKGMGTSARVQNPSNDDAQPGPRPSYIYKQTISVWLNAKQRSFLPEQKTAEK
ncbi:MAG: hypothetical protein EOO96_21135 [Pedobacter sp.]|nr:MAG: hypothetical protein EOO96_21135 [Pedobacter sp.]